MGGADRRGRWLLNCAIAALAVAAVLGALFWLADRDFGNEPFDAEVWTKARGGLDHIDDSPRGPMVRSLRKTHRLKGMTQEQVLAGTAGLR